MGMSEAHLCIFFPMASKAMVESNATIVLSLFRSSNCDEEQINTDLKHVMADYAHVNMVFTNT